MRKCRCQSPAYISITINEYSYHFSMFLMKMQPDGIVISPGPGHPADKKSFGICGDIIETIGPKIPVLGVCLGHQGIVHVYGGKVINAHVVRHGKTSKIKYVDNELFEKLVNPFVATRYHSLVASRKDFP